MSEPVRIIVTVFPKLTWKTAVAPLLQMLLIGVGIVTDSAAMQWAGFICLFVIVFCYAVVNGKTDQLSIPEARKRLDEIEAGRWQ